MTRLEQFAMLPVMWRAAAAAGAIYADLDTTVEQRCEILGLAIWPPCVDVNPTPTQASLDDRAWVGGTLVVAILRPISYQHRPRVPGSTS